MTTMCICPACGHVHPAATGLTAAPQAAAVPVPVVVRHFDTTACAPQAPGVFIPVDL